MKVLTFCDFYLPGYKSGGPAKSISSLVSRLGDEIDFHIVTRDRDAGDSRPYQGVTSDQWGRVGKAHVLYLAPRRIRLRHLLQIVSSTPHDVIYLNSFFSQAFTVRILALRRLGLLGRAPCIVAPRGELSAGALSLKSRRKRLYMSAAHALDLYRGVVWHVSSEYEQKDVRGKASVFRQPTRAKTITVVAPALPVIAPDLASADDGFDTRSSRPRKESGALNIVYLSRITRMKNLSAALSMLRTVTGALQFHIYGPVDDIEYWTECQKQIRALPHSISVTYHGGVERTQVLPTLSQHELFFLPTKGENFGHVIFEALTAGCPVLISDRTPWRSLLPRKLGCDLPLEQPAEFGRVLQQFADMDEEEFQEWSRRAAAFARDYLQDERALAQNRRLFLEVVSQVGSGAAA